MKVGAFVQSKNEGERGPRAGSIDYRCNSLMMPDDRVTHQPAPGLSEKLGESMSDFGIIRLTVPYEQPQDYPKMDDISNIFDPRLIGNVDD
jgi:hypothetical protein